MRLQVAISLAVCVGNMIPVGTLRTNIAPLQANGMLDETFDAMAGPSGLVRMIALAR